jgi:hypothetical protein
MKLPAAGYSAFVATSAAKAGSYGMSYEILLALPTPPGCEGRASPQQATGYAAKENHEEFLENDRATLWHIDCDMTRQKAIRREILDSRET